MKLPRKIKLLKLSALLSYDAERCPHLYFCHEHPSIIAKDANFYFPGRVIRRYTIDWCDLNNASFVGAVNSDSYSLNPGELGDISLRWFSPARNNLFTIPQVFSFQSGDEFEQKYISWYLSKRVDEFIANATGFSYGSSTDKEKNKHNIEELIHCARKYVCGAEGKEKAKQKAEEAYQLYSKLNYDKVLDSKINQLFNDLYKPNP
jgi:hypothetical protein